MMKIEFCIADEGNSVAKGVAPMPVGWLWCCTKPAEIWARKDLVIHIWSYGADR
jgi:hypothetical protein